MSIQSNMPQIKLYDLCSLEASRVKLECFSAEGNKCVDGGKETCSVNLECIWGEGTLSKICHLTSGINFLKIYSKHAHFHT